MPLNMSQTKLKKSLERNIYFLKRKRIDQLIENSLKKPVTLVTAGAGFGKTQTIYSSLAHLEQPYIWMQCSELDNLTVRFWEQFTDAFQETHPYLARKMVSFGFPDSAFAYHQLLRVFEKTPEENSFILVIDDFHSIENPSILAFFEMLITAEIPTISIILISRHKPAINTTALFLKNILSTIEQEDLRFTIEETKEYLLQQNLKLNEQSLKKLYEYTEGWIIAIYLVSLGIKTDSINIEHLIASSKLNIYELLEKEIFISASEKMKNILIKISLLDFIPEPLMLSLLRNDSPLFHEFNTMGLLIWYDAQIHGYRIHNLFKMYLQSKAALLPWEEIKSIHLSFATWYQENNYFVEAINHYKICHCYDKLIPIIISIRQHYSHEITSSFIALIEQAPKEIIDKYPIIRVVRANFLFSNNQIEQAYVSLCEIQNEYEKYPYKKETNEILGEVYTTLGLISIVKQKTDYISLFQKADHCLPEGSKLYDERINLAEGLNICGIKNPKAGELEKNSKALFTAAPYVTKVMNGGGYGMEYLCATDAALMTGDFKNLEKFAYEAIYRANSRKQYDIEYMASFYLLRMYIAKGNYQLIQDMFTRLQNKSELTSNSTGQYILDIMEGWFYVKLGQYNNVPSWIMDEEKTRKVLAPVILGREYLVRSDSLLGQERYYELLAFMEQQDEIYRQRGILYALIQNEITRAIIYHYTGNFEQSLACLTHAYTLSSPNDIIFQYIEYGSQMRTVLSAAKNNKKCTIPKDWLNKMTTRATTYAKMLAKVSSMYHSELQNEKTKPILSKREIEILTYLCDGLTREEMAISCNLSSNTIKSVLQSIYSKLGAINNFDAVRIATEQELI